MKNFFILFNGNNGATYIVNTLTLDSVVKSLNFYKARTVKSKLTKGILILLSWFLGKINFKRLKNINEVNVLLNDLFKSELNFNIDTNSSVLISPTNDKVIVNHHNDYFQKFAFCQSYKKVNNEAKVYKLFTHSTNFQVSNFYDEKNILNNFCSFKLKNRSLNLHKNTTDNFGLVFALVEFFKVSNQQNYSIYKYVDFLQAKLVRIDKNQFKSQVEVFDELKDKFGHLSLPLGLVHRDFKPWNILYSKKILIYDFEETIIDGPPLEDLFNYFIDPIILYNNPRKVIKHIYSKKNIELYTLYLKELDVEIHFEFFLQIFLSNRILFMKNENKKIMMNRYIDLSNHLISCK